MVGPSSPPLPSGYQGFYSRHDPAQGYHVRCDLFISTVQDMSFTSFNVNSPLEVVAGRIHLQRFYTICSIYLPSSTPVDREELYSLFRQLPSHFLVLGDFNGDTHCGVTQSLNPGGLYWLQQSKI